MYNECYILTLSEVYIVAFRSDLSDSHPPNRISLIHNTETPRNRNQINWFNQIDTLSITDLISIGNKFQKSSQTWPEGFPMKSKPCKRITHCHTHTQIKNLVRLSPFHFRGFSGILCWWCCREISLISLCRYNADGENPSYAHIHWATGINWNSIVNKREMCFLFNLFIFAIILINAHPFLMMVCCSTS